MRIRSLLPPWAASPQPPDVHLISFPKCGRTWLRLMLGHAIASHLGRPIEPNSDAVLALTPLAEWHAAVPRILVHHADNPQWKKPGELELPLPQYRGQRVVLLVRDPRDAVVSNYFEVRYRTGPYAPSLKQLPGLRAHADRIQPYAGDLKAFIRGEVGGLRTILAFYNGWAADHAFGRSWLLLRYEDLHARPLTELRRVTSFVGLPDVTDKVLSDAVAYARFENMHRMEAAGAFDSFVLKPADAGNRETFKTRRGKVGGHREYCDPEDIAYMDAHVDRELADLYGYRSRPLRLPS